MTREEAIKALNDYGTLFPSDKGEAIDMAIEALKDRPRGHWRVIDEYSACSVCDAEIDWYDLPYCPFCGADMRGEKKMEKPTRPDEGIEVTKKAPEKAPLGVTSGVKEGRDVIMVPTDRIDEFVEKESRKRSNIAPTSSSEEFRGRLARSIKAAGRWMEDNAEGIAGSVERRRSLDIHLSWECSGNEIAPTINIDSDFLCFEAIDEMHRKEIEK